MCITYLITKSVQKSRARKAAEKAGNDNTQYNDQSDTAPPPGGPNAQPVQMGQYGPNGGTVGYQPQAQRGQ